MYNQSIQKTQHEHTLGSSGLYNLYYIKKNFLSKFKNQLIAPEIYLFSKKEKFYLK